MEKLMIRKISSLVLVLIGTIGFVLGLLLPFMEFSVLDVYYQFILSLSWVGKLMIALALINCVLMFQDSIFKLLNKEMKSNLRKILRILSFILVLIITIYAVYMFLHLNIFPEYTDLSIGFWLILIGLIAIIIGTILYKDKK